ncbi:MAG: phospholipase D-like domain-containing protein [Bacteroidia bacterium]
MFYQTNKYKLTEGNHCVFLENGTQFFQKLKQSINNAKEFIHFQVYIYNEDETGKYIAELLENAAKRNVQIHMVLDAYGSNNLSVKFINYLKSFCTTFKFFSPLFVKYKINIGLRMHHKIFVFDGQYALIGGINIANKYSGINYTQQWLDFGLFINGPSVYQLNKICIATINRNPMNKKILSGILVEPKISGNIALRILQNDKYRNKIGITRAYRNNIRKSQQSITIISSYFLPSNSFRRLLIQAAIRNVNIKLVLGEVSDTKLVLFATRYFYKTLLKQGIEIYEWQKTVLHGKLAVFDLKTTTIGSYNLNALSDFGSLECNAEILNEEFSKEVSNTINKKILPNCRMVDADIFNRKYSFVHHLLNKISYHILIFLLNYLFLLQKKSAENILHDTEINEY